MSDGERILGVLRDRIRGCGMTQQQLSVRAGVSQAVLSRIATGKAERIRDRTIRKLARFFEIPLDVFGLSDDVPCAPVRSCIAQPFPLRRFVGRQEERVSLTEWFCAGDRGLALLTGIPGVGKTSLAWVWMNCDVIGSTIPGLPAGSDDATLLTGVPAAHRPESVIWWSFASNPSYRSLLAYACRHLCAETDRPFPAQGDRAETVTQLLEILQKKRVLLVLDAIEQVSDREAPSPNANPQAGPVDPGQEDVAGEQMLAFLQAVAGQGSSKVLAVGRVFPQALKGLLGAGRILLHGLAEDDAVRYLRESGIQGDDPKLLEAARAWDGHPLAIRLLCETLAEDFLEPCDVDAADRQGIANLVSSCIAPSVADALNRIGEDEHLFLADVALAPEPLSREAIRSIAERSDMPLDRVGATLEALSDYSLLVREDQDSWVVHPILRAYFQREYPKPLVDTEADREQSVPRKAHD